MSQQDGKATGANVRTDSAPIQSALKEAARDIPGYVLEEAKKGDPSVLCAVGTILCKTQPKNAVIVLNEAIRKGSSEAARTFADCYENGRAVKQNHKKALEMYVKSIKMIAHEWIEKDPSKATTIFKELFECHRALSCMSLGLPRNPSPMFATGESNE